MECRIKISDEEYIFKLYRNTDKIIVLQCNGWNLFEITEKGLRRCGSVRLDAPFIDRSNGVVQWRTIHNHMKVPKGTGKRDIQLRLNPSDETLYINAVVKDSNDIHICYIDSQGLYLWIDDRHEQNSYAASIDRTILVIE